MADNRIKLSAIGFMTTLLMLGTPALAAAHGTNDKNKENKIYTKITLCKATGSQSNPYEKVTLNPYSIVYGQQNSGDIIPPFTYTSHGTQQTFPGQNWTTEGQAIFNNNCMIPSGGKGGGGGGQTTPPTTQAPAAAVTTTPSVTGKGAGQVSTTVTVPLQQPSQPQVVAPQGGVNAGAGGAPKVYSAGSLFGLVGSLASLVSGLAVSIKRI